MRARAECKSRIEPHHDGIQVVRDANPALQVLVSGHARPSSAESVEAHPRGYVAANVRLPSVSYPQFDIYPQVGVFDLPAPAFGRSASIEFEHAFE